MLDIVDLFRALATYHSLPDARQQQAVHVPASAGLFIVAGPGTGKTASLTLCILKLALVDGLPPRGILATTFTKKAAEELRSRALGWGFRIVAALKSDPALSPKQKSFVDAVDINHVRTGEEAPSLLNPTRMKFDRVFRDISRQGRKFGIGLGWRASRSQRSRREFSPSSTLSSRWLSAIRTSDEKPCAMLRPTSADSRRNFRFSVADSCSYLPAFETSRSQCRCRTMTRQSDD
jgi:hypothetical protein